MHSYVYNSLIKAVQINTNTLIIKRESEYRQILVRNAGMTAFDPKRTSTSTKSSAVGTFSSRGCLLRWLCGNNPVAEGRDLVLRQRIGRTKQAKGQSDLDAQVERSDQTARRERIVCHGAAESDTLALLGGLDCQILMREPWSRDRVQVFQSCRDGPDVPIRSIARLRMVIDMQECVLAKICWHF